MSWCIPNRRANFNPRPPRGGRPVPSGICVPGVPVCQSTPSARRATALKDRIINREQEFQSTPSARRATRLHRRGLLCLLHFNPRPPRGGRPDDGVDKDRLGQFQSTPSARRATTPGGGLESVEGISIHALREEGDPTAAAGGRRGRVFQSTPSARRATSRVLGLVDCRRISIHALREEGDQDCG